MHSYEYSMLVKLQVLVNQINIHVVNVQQPYSANIRIVVKNRSWYAYFFKCPYEALSYAERPDYLPDCLVIILGGIILAEGIDYEAISHAKSNIVWEQKLYKNLVISLLYKKYPQALSFVNSASHIYPAWRCMYIRSHAVYHYRPMHTCML